MNFDERGPKGLDQNEVVLPVNGYQGSANTQKSDEINLLSNFQ